MTGKGNRRRVLHLPAKAAGHMSAYMSEFHGTGPDGEAYVFFSRNGGPRTPLSQDAVTLNIYASADANAKQAAAATIDEVMERRLSPQELWSFA